MNQRAEAAIKLAAQICNRDFDDVAFRIVIEVTDLIKQLGFGVDHAWRAREECENLKFFFGEGNFFVSARDFLCGQVDEQFTMLNLGVARILLLLLRTSC